MNTRDYYEYHENRETLMASHDPEPAEPVAEHLPFVNVTLWHCAVCGECYVLRSNARKCCQGHGHE